jgi:hypothetical protein
MNPLLLEIILKEKRRELLEEAERQRLVALHNDDNPGRRARLQLALGEFLIRQGEKIKRRSRRRLDLEKDLCHD